MPQLAPLNWILLMSFFWILTLCIIISVWWMKKKDYPIKLMKKHLKSKNKNWTW
uniref:ATP synthase complex subunit 8 n=1 Tax=Acanthopleura vaillantii TaxID=1169768 RepID=A0AA51NHF2_9MOLL|nr:ATP synthase F0 subunit 8 [Acanthopleura vaillantii]WMQ53046.1 ATP synthase F0 subunit 8 [Acanthopleura vaillantii]